MANSDPNLKQAVLENQSEQAFGEQGEENQSSLLAEQLDTLRNAGGELEAFHLPGLKFSLSSEDPGRIGMAAEIIKEFKSTKLEMASNADYREVFQSLVQVIEEDKAPKTLLESVWALMNLLYLELSSSERTSWTFRAQN